MNPYQTAQIGRNDDGSFFNTDTPLDLSAPRFVETYDPNRLRAMEEIATPVYESPVEGKTDSEIATEFGPSSGYVPANAFQPPATNKFMESNNAPGFFENILNQTGETLGNVIVNTVNAGSTAANAAINDLAPAPRTQPAPIVRTPMSQQMMYLLVIAIGSFAVYSAMKNRK